MISFAALAALRGWRLYAAVGVGVVMLLLIWQVSNWRRDAARLAEARAVAEQVEKERQASEELLRQKLEIEQEARSRAESREAEARAQAQQMAGVAAQLGRQAAALAERQGEIRREIAALTTPEELEIRIKRDLGLRRADDMTRPGFLVDELKLMAEAVAERPVLAERLDRLEQRTEALSGQVAAQEVQLEAVRDQLASERRVSAAWEQAHGELHGHYVTLYNSIGVRKRSPKCLWLWKCAEKKLPTPAPGELEP